MRAFSTVLIALVSLTVFGQDMFSNFGSGNSFDLSNAWRVSQVYSLAMPFSPSFTGQLGSVSLPLLNENGQKYLVQVFKDANGQPGDVLMAWETTPIDTIAKLDADPGIPMIQGAGYWLVVRLDESSQRDGGWFLNNVGDTGPFLRTINGQWTVFTDTRSAFKITAATPELYVAEAFVPEAGKGVPVGGDLFSLQHDDSDFLSTRAEIQRVAAELNATERIETHAVGRTYSAGDVRIVIRATPARSITAQYQVTAHNYASGQDVLIGQGTLPANGSELDVSLPMPVNASDFVEQSSGKMQIRITAKTTKLASGILILGIDFVQWMLRR